MSFKSPDKIFDELLIMRFQAGDKKALALLIKRWHPKIMRYAYRNTHDLHASEDIAQEVWIAAMKGIHRLIDQSKFSSWILGITHNKSMDWIKKNQGIKQEIGQDTNASDETESNQLMQNMRKAIMKLQAHQRNILTLYYLEGFSLIEIADILNISKGTVKSRLFYAREALKKEIKKYNHE